MFNRIFGQMRNFFTGFFGGSHCAQGMRGPKPFGRGDLRCGMHLSYGRPGQPHVPHMQKPHSACHGMRSFIG